MDWYDLTQPFHPNIPHSRALPSPSFDTLSRVEEDGSNVQHYSAPTHVGTHVDAPRHFVPGGATIDELPLSRFAGRAVVADVGRSEPGAISLEVLEDAIDAAGGLEPGDLLLVRTGWGAHYDDHETYQRYPWLGDEIADWLLKRDVTLLGVDTISPDRPRALRPDGWDEYPHHRTLLPAGVPIAEHLYLEAVAGMRLEVVGFPLKLRGGDGAPIRMAARDR